MSAARHGRIEERGSGVGIPTREEVEKRARELARIAGRTEVNKGDRINAQKELTGEMTRLNSEDDAFTSWASRPDATGHQVDTESPGEEEIDLSLGEELISEGVDEALHDEMLEARREAAAEEEEEER